MKRKSFKIEDNTLFIYKKGNRQPNSFPTLTTDPTDTTSVITTTVQTTGIFNNERFRK